MEPQTGSPTTFRITIHFEASGGAPRVLTGIPAARLEEIVRDLDLAALVAPGAYAIAAEPRKEKS